MSKGTLASKKKDQGSIFLLIRPVPAGLTYIIRNTSIYSNMTH